MPSWHVSPQLYIIADGCLAKAPQRTRTMRDDHETGPFATARQSHPYYSITPRGRIWRWILTAYIAIYHTTTPLERTSVLDHDLLLRGSEL